MALSLFLAAALFSTSCAALPKHPTPKYDVVTLKLDGEVDDLSIDLLRGDLKKAQDKADTIILEINSPGGEVNAGFELARDIEDSEVPVICVVDFEAASMAAYILESCKVRIMTKRSSLMIHEPAVNGQMSGGQTNWRNVADWMKATTKGMAEHFAARLNVTVPEILERIKGGAMWWMDWEEAVKFDAVDVVVNNVSDVRKSYEASNKPPPSVCRK
jgi:ATP-dependent Clp protease protease subunit